MGFWNQCSFSSSSRTSIPRRTKSAARSSIADHVSGTFSGEMCGSDIHATFQSPKTRSTVSPLFAQSRRLPKIFDINVVPDRPAETRTIGASMFLAFGMPICLIVPCVWAIRQIAVGTQRLVLESRLRGTSPYRRSPCSLRGVGRV